jgi:hypothetical protein
MSAMRAVLIGECMVELGEAGEGRYVRSLAGDAYSTAVCFRREAPEAETEFLTATGDDTLSWAMRTAWAQAALAAAARKVSWRGAIAPAHVTYPD